MPVVAIELNESLVESLALGACGERLSGNVVLEVFWAKQRPTANPVQTKSKTRRPAQGLENMTT